MDTEKRLRADARGLQWALKEGLFWPTLGERRRYRLVNWIAEAIMSYEIAMDGETEPSGQSSGDLEQH